MSRREFVAEVEAAVATGEAKAKIITAEADATAYRMKAGAEADGMKMKGYTYQQETAREVGVGSEIHSSSSRMEICSEFNS